MVGGEAEALFVSSWQNSLAKKYVALLVLDIYAIVHPKDREYFRQSREQMVGCSLEEVCQAAVCSSTLRCAAVMPSL